METGLCEGIDWVGYVDWTVRDFHGYVTQRGSSYNSYLIRDEKTVLIDTVKAPYVEELLANVSKRVPLSKVDLVVCNHAEPDHSGGLPAVLAACPNAELVCNAKCKDALTCHYETRGWRFRVVTEKDRLSIGRRTLQFIDTPMVHWPESMFTHVPEEGLLFSMDALGQHYASAGRFDDETDLAVVMEEAKTYYANIVMLYGSPIARTLEKASGLDIRMAAPSHGVIWRSHLATIVAAYRAWVVCKPVCKVVILYDTMWRSTERMAHAIWEGAVSAGVDARLHNVRVSELTVLATEVLDAAVLAVGSPTLNKTLMPQMAAALTYLKGLGPVNKKGLAFGSYGWVPGGPKDVEEYLKQMKVTLLREALVARFVPGEETLADCRRAGGVLAQAARESCGVVGS